MYMFVLYFQCGFVSHRKIFYISFSHDMNACAYNRIVDIRNIYDNKKQLKLFV